jgi:hypothetical protein
MVVIDAALVALRRSRPDQVPPTSSQQAMHRLVSVLGGIP